MGTLVSVIFQGAYIAQWKVRVYRKVIQVNARFEGAPSIIFNGKRVVLGVYGEDWDEIVRSNRKQIKEIVCG